MKAIPRPILIFALLVIFISASSFSHELRAAETNIPSAPRIRCVIEMHQWCIAGIDGPINLTTEGNQRRIWTVQDRTSMKEGPLRIIESSWCAGHFETRVTLDKREVREVSGKRINSVEYEIDTGKCTLEFQWPALEESNSAYERAMLYSILIGQPQNKKQLYNFLK